MTTRNHSVEAVPRKITLGSPRLVGKTGQGPHIATGKNRWEALGIGIETAYKVSDRRAFGSYARRALAGHETRDRRKRPVEAAEGEGPTHPGPSWPTTHRSPRAPRLRRLSGLMRRDGSRKLRENPEPAGKNRSLEETEQHETACGRRGTR